MRYNWNGDMQVTVEKNAKIVVSYLKFYHITN